MLGHGVPYYSSVMLKVEIHPKNLTVSDVVLIQYENLPRRIWPLGKVINVYPSRDALVRSAQLKKVECVDQTRTQVVVT